MSVSRRHFVAGSLAGASGVAWGGPALHGLAKAQRYRTALIGSGWWGTNILREAIAAGQSEVVALCDVDENQLRGCQQEIAPLTRDEPKSYRDYREMLAKERPEIVIVGTPDHWHPLNTIAAIEQGAHVYVEKPVSHTILEGRAMVKAARENDRVVQVGTHRRVSPHNVSGMEFLKSGKAGQIGAVRSFVHYGGGPGTKTPDAEPPAGLDWDLWCGPAPKPEFNPKIHPKGFRNFLDYANGTLGDWGIHWLDQILWWTDEVAPTMVAAIGDRYISRDGTTAPDCMHVIYKFDSFDATWEHRRFAANNAENHNIGCYFYGTEGTFHMGWQDGWNFYPTNAKKAATHVDPQLNKPDDQNIKELWADFLEAIASKRRPVCDIEIGHRSTTMSLMGMLSWKLGRSIAWDPDAERCPGDDEANALLTRAYRGEFTYPDYS